MRIDEVVKKKTSKDKYQKVDISSDYDYLLAIGKKVVSLIATEAKPWMKATNNGLLKVYRGVDEDKIAFTQNVRDDRKPRDTEVSRHQIFNQLIQLSGGAANRSNAVFTSGYLGTTKSYGNPYVLIPLGDFKYTWSPEFEDWSTDFNKRDIGLLHTDKDSDLLKKATELGKKELTKHISNLKKQTKSKWAKNEVKKLENPKYYSKELQLFVDSEYDELKRQIGIKKFDIKKIDIDKVKKVIIADRALQKAIKSGNELMIKANTVLYISLEFYRDFVIPILNKKKPYSANPIEYYKGGYEH